MNRLVAVIFAGVIALGLFVFNDSSNSIDDAPAVDISGSPEALQWLRGNESESALASNRFGPTSEAIGFVNRLYSAGAERVVIPQDAIEDHGIEVYADSLVVIMPHDPEKCRRVREICDREIRSEGFDPDEDRNADQVYLWWD
jgi:hypothetical protein